MQCKQFTNVSGGGASTSNHTQTCDCSQLHSILLPIFAEEVNWSKSVRAVLYFIAMIYSFFGIYVAVNRFMTAVIRITNRTKLVTVYDQYGQVISEKKELIWNRTIANLTLLAFGSSSPEIFLSIIESVGNNFQPGPLASHAIVGSAAFNLLLVTAITNLSVPKLETRKIKFIYSHTVCSVFAIVSYVWLQTVLEWISPNVVELWEAILTLLFFLLLLLCGYFADKRICCPDNAADDGISDTKSIKSLSLVSGATSSNNKNNNNNLSYQMGSGSFRCKKSESVGDKLRNFASIKKRPTDNSIFTSTSNGRPSSSSKSSSKSLHLFSNNNYIRHLIVENPDVRPLARNLSMYKLRHMNRPESVQRYFELERKFKAKYPQMTPEQLARVVAAEIEQARPHNKVYYRLEPGIIKKIEHMQMGPVQPKSFKDHNVATVSISAKVYHIGLDKPKLMVKVIRSGYTKSVVTVRYETMNARAIPNEDFKPSTGTLKFDPDVLVRSVQIRLPKTATAPENPNIQKFFFLRLEKIDLTNKKIKIGEPMMSEIHIVKSTTVHQNLVSFCCTSSSTSNGLCVEGDLLDFKSCIVKMGEYSLYCEENIGTIQIPVTVDGYAAHPGFHVDWVSIDETADEGLDYIGKYGRLFFEPGEQKKFIGIPIVEDFIPEKHETFLIRLLNSGSSVEIGQPNETRVIILGDRRTEEEFLETDKLLPSLFLKMQPGAQSWADQFKRAANVNEGDLDTASASDYIWHVLLFYWNIMLSFIPPLMWFRGWLTFIVSLAMIGFLTTLAADSASIFGCLVHLPEEVTAIIFVVLGTGLPDLFASRLAAIYEDTADSSIGHVVGDSSVNVFVGLGLPWTISAIYWQVKGQSLSVNTRGLPFNVLVYGISSFIAIVLLYIRRNLPLFGRAELGGPQFTKWATSILLILLYVNYVTLCILNVYGLVGL